jgi:hypothetical protein
VLGSSEPSNDSLDTHSSTTAIKAEVTARD